MADNRVQLPRDLYESMNRVYALYQMGLLIPAPADAPIKLPKRDIDLPEARHTPAPGEAPVVGRAGPAPEKLDGVPRIPSLGLSSEWRGTNAAAPPTTSKPDAQAA